MSITVRASSFGGCIKAQVAGCLRYEPMLPPDRMQAVFDAGHEHEDANAAALRADGYAIDREQEEVQMDRLPVGSVVGHIDGVITHWDFGERLWESKSPNAWAKFEKAYKTGDWSDPLAHRYAWQISVYMHALGLEAYVTCVQDDGTILGFVIETPPFTHQDIVDRLISINEWVKIGTLPQLCTSRDYPCPFVYLHEDDLEVVRDVMLDGMVSDYLYWAEQEKIAAQKKREAQLLIRDHVDGAETVTEGGSKVTVYEQASAARYDMERLRADLAQVDADLDMYLIPGKSSTRIKITRTDG